MTLKSDPPPRPLGGEGRQVLNLKWEPLFCIAYSESLAKNTYNLSETFFSIHDRWRCNRRNSISSISLTENPCLRFCNKLTIKIPRFHC